MSSVVLPQSQAHFCQAEITQPFRKQQGPLQEQHRKIKRVAAKILTPPSTQFADQCSSLIIVIPLQQATYLQQTSFPPQIPPSERFSPTDASRHLDQLSQSIAKQKQSNRRDKKPRDSVKNSNSHKQKPHNGSSHLHQQAPKTPEVSQQPEIKKSNGSSLDFFSCWQPNKEESSLLSAAPTFSYLPTLNENENKLSRPQERSDQQAPLARQVPPDTGFSKHEEEEHDQLFYLSQFDEGFKQLAVLAQKLITEQQQSSKRAKKTQDPAQDLSSQFQQAPKEVTEVLPEEVTEVFQQMEHKNPTELSLNIFPYWQPNRDKPLTPSDAPFYSDFPAPIIRRQNALSPQQERPLDQQAPEGTEVPPQTELKKSNGLPSSAPIGRQLTIQPTQEQLILISDPGRKKVARLNREIIQEQSALTEGKTMFAQEASYLSRAHRHCESKKQKFLEELFNEKIKHLHEMMRHLIELEILSSTHENIEFIKEKLKEEIKSITLLTEQIESVRSTLKLSSLSAIKNRFRQEDLQLDIQIELLKKLLKKNPKKNPKDVEFEIPRTTHQLIREKCNCLKSIKNCLKELELMEFSIENIPAIEDCSKKAEEFSKTISSLTGNIESLLQKFYELPGV